MKKLLICGDSFAADWTAKYQRLGWPNMLSQEYNITNLAQAGCSEYKIYQQLTSVNLQKFDNIIVSHTSPYRLYVKKHPIHYNDPLHKNSDLIYSDIKEYKELSSIVNYYENYFDLDYAKFIHNLICKEIDQLTKNYCTLHITSFDWKDLYNFSNMINFEDIFKKHRGLVNHYSEDGNNLVFEKIKSYL
jgi:hypothetical protein